MSGYDYHIYRLSVVLGDTLYHCPQTIKTIKHYCGVEYFIMYYMEVIKCIANVAGEPVLLILQLNMSSTSTSMEVKLFSFFKVPVTTHNGMTNKK